MSLKTLHGCFNMHISISNFDLIQDMKYFAFYQKVSGWRQLAKLKEQDWCGVFVAKCEQIFVTMK